ncbi:MAG: hypothetical protein IH608_13675, partial [Proteobacteria bacterium]|nr:hypothetical protein [Pseudomonadota bacterium]
LGNFDDFARKRAAEEAERTCAARAPEEEGGEGRLGKKEVRRLEAERRARARQETGPLRDEVARLEAAIAGAEGRLSEVEAALADPSTYGDPGRVSALARERAELARTVEELAERWERTATELEMKERSMQGDEVLHA